MRNMNLLNFLSCGNWVMRIKIQFRRYQFMFSKVINQHNLLNLGLHHCCNFWVGNRFLVKIDSFSQHTSKCLISSAKVSNCPILLIKRRANDIITSFWYGIISQFFVMEFLGSNCTCKKSWALQMWDAMLSTRRSFSSLFNTSRKNIPHWVKLSSSAEL